MFLVLLPFGNWHLLRMPAFRIIYVSKLLHQDFFTASVGVANDVDALLRSSRYTYLLKCHAVL